MNLYIRNLNDPDVNVPSPDLSSIQKLWAYKDPFDFEATEKKFISFY